jgi:hypothetical protein
MWKFQRLSEYRYDEAIAEDGYQGGKWGLRGMYIGCLNEFVLVLSINVAS